MSEEAEKKKPKTTLIKKQTENVDASRQKENKTVIVKKKKKVVVAAVRKTTENVNSEADEKKNAQSLQKNINIVDSAIQDQPAKQEPVVSRTPLKEKNLKIETVMDATGTESHVSTQKIISGKDTEASPPKKSMTGVQSLASTRTGGRAGVVAGRRVGGGSSLANRGDYSSRGRQDFKKYSRPSSNYYGKKSNSPNYEGRRPSPGEKFYRQQSQGYAHRRPNRPPGNGSGRQEGNRGPAGNIKSGQSGKNAFSSPNQAALPQFRNKKFYKSKKIYDKNSKEKEKLYEFFPRKQSIQVNPVPKKIDIMEVITVSELARKMNLKASDLISRLMGMGMMVTINQQIDSETATILADEYDCKVNIVNLYDETIIESIEDTEDMLVSRPPVVTVMGHVDHGKTCLLDAIRDSNVISGEYGGITQHIGAYLVNTPEGVITFLDTPGHSSFTMMRARGAKVTDLVVLVVAANDGVMPQTIEAIEHAQNAKAPIIVALNKMDLPDADPEKVKKQLSKYNLTPEEWGGAVQYVEISALKREGIDKLLEILLLESDMLAPRANPSCDAEGKILESRIDQGRGIVSTVLIQRGTLNVGDPFIAGIYHGKVRAMLNDRGEPVETAGLSVPVEILGFSGVPEAGDPFQVTRNEREARQYGVKRQELKKMETAKNVKKITLSNLYDSIQQSDTKELRVIIKGDVHGSVEALKSALESLSNEEVRLCSLRAAAGAIIEDDVNLAIAAGAIIVGFHVRPTAKAQIIAEREKIEILKYNVIYDAIGGIKAAMEGMLSPDIEEIEVGLLEVREIFNVPRFGVIAGCMVTSGVINRKKQNSRCSQ